MQTNIPSHLQANIATCARPQTCARQLREWSFLMSGTSAEGNCPVYEKCSSWDPGV